MEKLSTFKQRALTAFFACMMMLMGQSAWAQSDDFYLTVIGGSKADGSNEGCEKLVDGLADKLAGGIDYSAILSALLGQLKQ